MDTLASKFVGKEPIPQPQRPFNVDYPQATGSSPGSRLTTSIDGSPLSPTAAIAGRSTVGGADQAIGHEGLRSASENLGSPWNFVPQRALPKNTVGTLNPATGEVNVLETLTGYGQARTGGHEFSHLIDELSGKIPTKGLESPLSQMFSELNTQGYVSKWQKGATPELYGYKGADVGREKMAEAIYAYLRDPNYIKSKFPEVAKRIREYVNTNPNLKDVIQFNSAGGLAAGWPLVMVALAPRREVPGDFGQSTGKQKFATGKSAFLKGQKRGVGRKFCFLPAVSHLRVKTETL